MRKCIRITCGSWDEQGGGVGKLWDLKVKMAKQSLMGAKMARLRLIVAVVLVALVASAASVKVPEHKQASAVEKIHRAVRAFNMSPHGAVKGLSPKGQEMLNVIHRVNRKWNNEKLVKHAQNLHAGRVDLSKIKFQPGKIHRPTQKIIGKDGKEYTLQAM